LQRLVAVSLHPNLTITDAASSVATDRLATPEARVAAIEILLVQGRGWNANLVIRDRTAGVPGVQRSIYEFSGPPLLCQVFFSGEVWQAQPPPPKGAEERITKVLIGVASSAGDAVIVRHVAACAAGIPGLP
jgi:hypothetical protein